jgi:fumarylacetoacetase
VFGVVLLNDWSARDIQAWEYVPLGPFLGKSFATSISPWVVTLDALAAARVPVPGQDPSPLPYLRGEGADGTQPAASGLDVHYEVDLNATVISRPELRHLYWSPAQLVAHLTVNGATIRNGDLLGSGTISGPSRETLGCLLEQTRNGTEPIALDDGTTRAYLDDGDTVTLRAWAPGPDGARIGLGEVTGTILPSPHGSS